MRRLLALALALVLPLAGCGYALVGSGGTTLPPEIHTIATPSFANHTNRPGVEQWLTEAVAREIAGRGHVTVVGGGGKADATLQGDVRSYNAWPVVLDDAGRALEYQIVLTASAKLVTASGTTILQVDDFRFEERYKVENQGDFSDLENQAVEALASRFAQSLVAALFEGF